MISISSVNMSICSCIIFIVFVCCLSSKGKLYLTSILQDKFLELTTRSLILPSVCRVLLHTQFIAFSFPFLSFFFCFKGCTHSTCKFLGQRLNPSRSSDLYHSSGSALSHCTGLGIEPVIKLRILRWKESVK